MKRKGFTLIELLAVIVIIAVIALITIPLVINVIEKSQRNAFLDSAYGIIEAGKLYYVENINDKETVKRYDFEVENKKFVLKDDSTKELKFTGTMPERGTMQLHQNGETALAICQKSYCACKSVKEINVTLKEGNCNIDSETGEIEDEKGVDGNPAGTVISYMGNSAPEGYLACDGKVYNISDYNGLAEQIKKEFGSYNYFGGDGTTTFAVPDLRGEFLRGTGTASRDTGSGADVGVHQDATLQNYISFRKDSTIYLQSMFSTNQYNENTDKVINSENGGYINWNASNSGASGTRQARYTARPTNTSVLYVIKY